MRYTRRFSLRWLTLLCLMYGCGSSSPSPASRPSPPHLITNVSVGVYPRAVAVDPTTHVAYVLNTLPVGATAYGAAGTVSVIDGTSYAVTSTITVGVFPFAAAVDPTTDTIFVANSDFGDVSVISGTSNTVITNVQVGNSPIAVGVDPEAHTVYALNIDNTVTIFDERTNLVVATVAVGYGQAGGGGGIGIDPTTHTVYVATQNSDSRVAPQNASTLTVIDGSSYKVVTTLPVGGNPVAVVVDPSTHTVYVANSLDNTLSVINGSANSVSTTLSVCSLPLGAAIDTATHIVYLACNGDRSVSGINGTTNAFTVPLPDGAPNGIAVDSTTHTVYVTNNGESGMVSVIGGVQ
jgi:YVTN family beta-propeller protein